MKNVTLKVLVLAFSVFFIGNINGQEIIDLTGINNANILVDTLPDVSNGAIIILDTIITYNAGGYAFDKSVIISGHGLATSKIDCSANFNFADGALVDSIAFSGIEFFGEFDSRYVINSNVSATVGRLMFYNCYIHDLRGVLRMKDAGPGSIDTCIIYNCEINMIRDYGIIAVDRNDWMVNHILIKNSSISKVRSFLTSRNNSTTVIIEDCTLNEVTSTGREMFRWRESGQDNITEGITIKNTIWGGGWDEEGGGTAIDGFAGLGETNWTVENTHATNELIFAEGKDTIFPLLENVYDGMASDLWTYPFENEFNYLDKEFSGIGTSGDPRWAVATDDGGLEWNMSHHAYNSLGDVDSTQTIAGLTIYAHSGKKVIVDENNKNLDGMEFTHRLKLGGSGDFGEWGEPRGRVLSIDVLGNTNITVAAMSSSSSEDRVLNIAADFAENVISEIPALGTELTFGQYFYQGESTQIYFYSTGSGVNVYYLKAVPVATSIKEFDISKPEVTIYPNPVSDRVYIDFHQPIRVAVYNIAGSLLKSKMIHSSVDYISVRDLQPGIYLIRSQNKNTFSKKFIKK